MNHPLLFVCVGFLLSNCAHTPTAPQVEMTPPWQSTANGIAELVEQHAGLTAFDGYRESSVSPERLQSFSAVEHITAGHDLEFSKTERKKQQQRFDSATTVWHYTFECQFAGILFCDKAGRVVHAILFG